MRIAILAFSDRGLALGQKIAAALPGQISAERCEKGCLAAWTETHFSQEDALVFVSSCGIAVRAVSPHVCSKLSDPAVVVVDEGGNFAISLLSGHLGGANELARQIADAVGAEPVITTATDVNGLFAVDVWAKKQGLAILNPEKIKVVSGRLVSGETVRVRSEFPVVGKLPKGLVLTEGDCDMEITLHPQGDCLHLIPRIVTMGIGCRRDTPAEKIEAAFAAMPVHPAAVEQVCSIDLKSEEPGLLEFCGCHGFPFVCYSSAELAALPGEFTTSAFVQSVTGVDNVCERSAVKGSGGRLLVPKTAADGVTVAAAIREFTVNLEG